MKKNKGIGGFSLVEVLIAMAILAIVSLPILSIFTKAAQTNAKAYRIENANTAANNIMEEVKNVSVSDLETNALNYKYSKVENSESEDARNISKYMVSNNSEKSFTGNDGEDFLVELTLDPSYYANDVGDGNLNLNNNVNSYDLIANMNLSTERNVIYRDDSINYDAITHYKEILGDEYDKSKIQKHTSFEVSIVKDTSVADLVSYVQKVTAKVSYSYDGLSLSLGAATGVASDYTREFVVSEKPVTATKYSNSGDYDYIITSENGFDNNAENVYLFYSIFDDYNPSASTIVSAGVSTQIVRDKIEVDYVYDTKYNDRVLFEGMNFFLVQQSKVSAGVNLSLGSNSFSSYISLGSDKSDRREYEEYTGGGLRIGVVANTPLLDIDINLCISLFGLFGRCGCRKETQTQVQTVPQTTESAFELPTEGSNSGFNASGTNYIYRVILKVYYREKTENNLVTTIVTTKTN